MKSSPTALFGSTVSTIGVRWRSQRFSLPCLLPAIIGAVLQGPSASIAVEVPRWQPHDFVFRPIAPPEAPFNVALEAVVAGPGGIRFTVPGFYDGDGAWKVRVSPTVEGAWSLETRSSLPELDGRPETFSCTVNRNNRVHGGLRIDPAHPRHFIYEDGSRRFVMGYECDWLWALDMMDPTLPRVNRFLDKLVEHGFNHILLNTYAHDTAWRKGRTSKADYGPPLAFAWEGTNEKPIHARFNLDYWQYFDQVIEALHQRGITAHLMIKVYNKYVNWPSPTSPDDDRFFRWVIARYAAYPNIVWDFSKEAHNEKDLEYKLNRFRFIREHDGYRRLITNHDDDAAYDRGAYDDLLDFRSDQQHNRWHETILAQRQRREWPIVNVEFGYEHGPGGMDDKTYGVVQPPEEVLRRAWEVCMAGGYSAYYYTHTAWDVIRPDDTPVGYAYFKNLRAFFEGTRYWTLEPAKGLVSEGYCLAKPGREYIVFLNRAKSFTFTPRGARGPLRATWFEPLTGRRVEAGELRGESHQLEPPAEWGSGMVALLLVAQEK